MGRSRFGVRWLLLALSTAFGVGCGGGSSFMQPPPPQPDFVLGIAPNPAPVTQGGSSSAVNVTVTAENGFSGSVQVKLMGLPAGVTTNPASPFTVAAGGQTPVIFGAAANVPTGNIAISAQGTSGALSHTDPFTLMVESAALPAVARTTYVRTDSTAALDNPTGEFHHRHIVYDAVHGQVFVANRTMNRVEVFSSTTQTRTAQIAVPGVSSVDISQDGSTVWAGSVTERIFAIDTTALQVKASFTISALAPIPNTVFDLPEEVMALAGGNFYLRLRQSGNAEALLALWNPGTNALSNLTSAEPQLFQNGLGVMARSADGTHVLIGASDGSGELALFDANGNVTAGPRGLGAGTLPVLAANASGSEYAAVLLANGNSQLYLLDAALNPVAGPLASSATSLLFSRDGSVLYALQPGAISPVVNVFDARTLALKGQAPDAAMQGVSTQIEDADATQLLFGLGNRGVVFLDAANPAALPASAPSFAAAPAASPAEGPATGGTALALAGQNFTTLSQMHVGTQQAQSPAQTSATELQATTPPSATGGAANISAYFANGWLAVAPDTFSYGPQILQVLPNAGQSAGGDTVQIYGYGFGSDPTKLTVTFAGSSATVKTVSNVGAISQSLGLDSSYPFSLECITLQTPAGTPGKADVAVTAPSGETTAAKAFQFLQSVQFHGKPGLYKFIAYDQSRQHLYLSNIDHVDVFDLGAQQFLAALEPPGGPPPDAGLRGLSLSPDGSQLVVADFGAQSVYLIDPDAGTGSAVPVGGVPGFLNSGPARVAATSAQSVFVGLSGEGAQGACSSCLGQLNLAVNPPVLQPATQPEVTSITGAPLLQANASGDQVFVAFGAAPGSPLALWQASAPNQFTVSNASASTADIGASADGNMFAVQRSSAAPTSGSNAEMHGADLSLAAVPTATELAQYPSRNFVPGIALHPSGALIYQPFLTGAPAAAGVQGGVDILDAHSGALRLRILLPQQFMTDIDGLHGSFLTTDENGARLFAITSMDGTPQNSGVTVVQLAKVPLGIGTLSPANGPAAGGTTITLRGSGFVSGVTVTIGGKSATASFKDGNTLTIVTPSVSAGAQQVQIKNPDGETVSLDAAFTAN
jgi:IPT/TIG domain-containing protein